MKSFALVDGNNLVLNVSLADDDWSADGWVEYQNSNPAFIGGDLVNGYFYPPQPFASWTRNQGTWVAPVEMPIDGKFYFWDEQIGNWVENEII